jgi:ribose transport system permease protein
MSVASGSESIAPGERKGKGARLLPLPSLSREVVLLLLILLQIIVFSLVFPVSFPTFGNFAAIMRNLATDGIMAVGMMLLLVGGLFDLSVGGMFSMTGVVTGWLLKEMGMPLPLAVLSGLSVAAFGGLINGYIVAKIKVNALIATLGTMGIFRGVAILIGGASIDNLPKTFTALGQAQLFGIQSPVWLMVTIALLFHYLLKHTRFFRQYYYIGCNEKAARLSGINVPKMQIFAFMLMGVLAGLCGITFASRIGTSVSIAGDGAELRVITAVILGGASLTGGKGTVRGAIIGVIFIALINNVLIIAAVSSYWQSIIIGTVLILAVAMDALDKRA